jgi:hypothetical protein
LVERSRVTPPVELNVEQMCTVCATRIGNILISVEENVENGGGSAALDRMNERGTETVAVIR